MTLTGAPERLYAAEVAARLEALLAERLVGAYLGGSLALGDYRPGRSDVDIAAVVDKPLERARKAAIGARLSHEALPCPSRRLELVVYTGAAAAAASLDAAFELNLNTGAETPFRLETAPGSAPGHWFAIDRSILAQAGVALTGPPARQTFAPIEHDLLRPLLVGSIAWHRRAILAPADESPDEAETRGEDAVLNACRSLRFLSDGHWSSKLEAGRWALEHDPSHGSVIATALAARNGAGEVDREAAGAFLLELESRF